MEEKPKEVAHGKLGGDDSAGMQISLSSLSLKGGGRKSANVPGSPIDSSQPILGDMNPKKKPPLPTPGSIVSAVKGFINCPSNPSSNGQGGYFPSRLAE
ncbi:hypothetical protein FRC05_007213 [Tulasnella sp. 425]|nr:hypothetical protein FRC05_007213 [Tulasnella sp. 425]